MNDNFKAGINYYSEFMCEAISSYLIAEKYFELSRNVPPERDLEKSNHYSSANYNARYAFLTAANALESAANALILGMDIGRSLYDELEKLSTLLKYEVFCISNGKRIDRSNSLYAKIKDVVKCRNEFVHPKPLHVNIRTNENDEIKFGVKRTKTRNYPLYISLFEPGHVQYAIRDILSFIAWVVFDICAYNIKEGALIIGNNTVSTTGAVSIAGDQYEFDLRSFGLAKLKV
jgi:hypothetical protein